MLNASKLARKIIDTDSTGSIQLRQSTTHYIMTAQLVTGDESRHTLPKQFTPIERLESHWYGFVDANLSARA